MFLFKKKKKAQPSAAGKPKGNEVSVASAQVVSAAAATTDSDSQSQSINNGENIKVNVATDGASVLSHEIHTPSSNVDVKTMFAQPQPITNAPSLSEPSSVTISAALLGRPPASQPSHPQLVENSPLVTSATSQDYVDRSPPDPRSPHGVMTSNAAFPPSYSSVIPRLDQHQQNFLAASAPSPDMFMHSSPATSYALPSPGPVVSPPTSHSGTGSYQNSPMPSMQPTPPMQPSQNPAYSPSLQTMPQSSISYPAPVANNNAWPGAAYQPQQQQQQQAYHGQQQYTHRRYVMPGSENQTYPIIMAIDWGTTYSSMAYAYQQDGEVHEVSTWPKQSHNYPKVPTCNLYGPGSKEILEWGYPAKLAMSKPPYKNHILLSKYKLHLDESAGPHPPLPNGLTVVDAIADYLRLFHAHVVQSALRGFGSAFEQHHIQYCLSVPAMWTDHAKSIMRQAALQAGMITPMDPAHRLLLISEPEAAALYCEKKCDQYSIGNGQRFMICDAGGGTVDLIVFEVAIGPQGRTLREVTRGSGHSCGSIFLDERMEALFRRKFSKWQEKGLTPANWVQLMETFIHNVKPLFDGIDDQYIQMPAVPGRADLTDYDIGLEDGVLTVTAEEMRREVFDPVVDDVLRLIQHQLQQTGFNCQAIFLVGGFGSSGYLLTRVRSEFSNIVRTIAVPPRAELAVVRGAAIAGIAPRTVAARVARRWYGVDSLMAFEANYDSPHKRVVDHEGLPRARDRFSVYVAPGQQIGVDECITKRYITYQYPNPVNSPLYACSALSLPRYVDSPLVEKIGDFTIPLPFIPGALPGHKVTFELRMYFGATEIRAEAEVNGMVVSTRCQFSG
ncbi:hypothetical protein EDD21DRAFT_383508 [Dissophora ornata]|nr:hypothetical protein EDD21DRAFT_383508 [Dissophora ornata]